MYIFGKVYFPILFAIIFIAIMEDLVNSQNALLTQLNTIKRNYEKTSIARRTKGYVTGKITAIDKIWESVQLNDIEIRAFKEFNQFFICN